MQIQELMSSNVCTIKTDTPLRDAAARMAKHDLGSLPVASGEKLVGMLTDRDIALRGIGNDLGPDACASEAMTRELLYCRAEDDVDEVLANMGDMQVRRLPVIDDDKDLVGIVSIGDLVKAEPARTGQNFAEITKSSKLHSQTIALDETEEGKSGRDDKEKLLRRDLRDAPGRGGPVSGHRLVASDNVEGTMVFRPGGEKIGYIDHFMVDKRSGKVEYAVMSFGGFLGLGEELRPVPWSVLSYDTELDGYVVSAEEDTFRNSPYLEGGTVPAWDSAYQKRIYQYWGVPIF